MLPRRPKCLRKAFSSVFEKWLNITPNPCISGHSGSFVINLVVSNFLYVYWGQTSLIVCGRKTTLKLWNDQQFFLICSLKKSTRLVPNTGNILFKGRTNFLPLFLSFLVALYISVVSGAYNLPKVNSLSNLDN